MRSKLERVINDLLPRRTNFHVSDLHVAFYGDETMGESSRGAHIHVNKVEYRQEKEEGECVEVLPPFEGRNSLAMPCGLL